MTHLTVEMCRVRKTTLTLWSVWRLLVLISALFLISFASCLSQGAGSQEELSGNWQERFDLRDTNKDGVLTMEEVGRPRLFRRLDANGDGAVTLTEANAFLDARPRRRRTAAASSEEWTARPKVGGGITENLNIPYASMPGVDPNLLSLDIYAPRDADNKPEAKSAGLPVLVMIHGGGWRRGDKANKVFSSSQAPFFVKNGTVFVSINYRLSPAVRYPAHVEDVAAALAWITDHIDSYGGDPGRVFVMGHSAGAHLAALVATDGKYLRKYNKSPSDLSGVILLDSAAYDIPRNMKERSDAPLPRMLYENAFGSDENVWRDASPVNHVAPKKKLPPFLVFFVGRPASRQISKEFVSALEKAGVPAAAVEVKGKDHNSISQGVGREDDATTRLIEDFLHGKRLSSFPPSV